MKRILVTALALALPLSASGQDDPSGNTLASSLDVFVFPADGQESSQQSKDEVECYDWAVANSGGDPFDLEKQQQQQQENAEAQMAAAEQVGHGSGARGAVRGAAAGAVVGEIVDGDSSQGAKYGAAAGVISGRRRGRAANEQAVAQAEQSAAHAEEATGAEIEDFKKAFSVCLEAKDYMVKY